MNQKIEVLQSFMFSIYKEIEKICKKHGLRVYASSGTAIGAVRHKGFIPWDDDFDVDMPREDMNKFFAIAQHELPEWLSLLTWRNCGDYMNLFAKVIVNKKDIVDRVTAESGMKTPEGLFVDIFPIDGYPSTWFGKMIRTYGVGFCRAMLKRFRSNKFYGPMEWILSRWRFGKCKYAMECAGWLVQEQGYAKLPDSALPTSESFGDGIAVPFEGSTIMVPNDCDKYLRTQFDDYMQLPPEDKRHPTHTADDVRYATWRLGPYNK